MTRAPLDILAGLQTLMAELTASMQEPDSDVSPKLQQALGATQRHTRAFMPTTADVPLESHESIRAKARAYKPTDYKFETDKPDRLKDYTPADDPDHDHDNSWALGTGDRKLIE
jgi:hypothetical protein